MHADRSSASAEWKAHWPLVAASTAGFSFATVVVATMGLFMEPLGREFGWTRAEVSLGLTMYALIAVPLSPFVGALIDRWGSRRLAIPGLLLAAACLAAFGLMNGSLILWFGLWAVYSAVALGIKGTVWTAAVASVFSSARGLALALTLSGSALAMTVAPVAAQWLVDNHGWRSAYLWLAVGWGGFVLVLVVPFFFDARDHQKRASVASGVPFSVHAVLTGLSVREAISNAALIRIGIATLVTVTMISAVSVHLVPLLSGKGLSRGTAAALAGSAGVASIAGKLATGWVLDRWRGAWMGGLSLMLPALAFILLLPGRMQVELAFLAVVLIGYSSGAFVQISAYMTSRYGGQRNFGKIYGTMASLSALGAGVGPVVAGLVYDQLGTYWPLLAGGIPLALLSGLLLIGLGPYPDWTKPSSTADGGPLTAP